ncbi:HalOD1 output domain-containing protein [Halorientalis brevis]|uniref:HalOD1 output domain-containing protein n=1 Tax=Halorientalis brevis TaxID=1126241 RepID=A0ABD6C836_9EURY
MSISESNTFFSAFRRCWWNVGDCDGIDWRPGAPRSGSDRRPRRRQRSGTTDPSAEPGDRTRRHSRSTLRGDRSRRARFALFPPSRSSANGTVSFTYFGYRVVVSSDGQVSVTDSD